LVLPSGKHYLDPEVLSRDLDRALDPPNQVGVHALQPIMPQPRTPILKVIVPMGERFLWTSSTVSAVAVIPT
jgi:hypothetical protein